MTSKRVILHVGDIGNDSDCSMRAVAALWIVKNRPDLFQGNVKHEFMELTKGQDFLAKNSKCDVVVIHNLFAPPPKYRQAANWTPYMMKMCKVSPLHDQDLWRKRLLETEAEAIITFGSSTEVSADYIGELPGYTYKTHYAPGRYDVYSKVKL